MTALDIAFAGEMKRLEPSTELTFGRAADIEIDTNQHLHRRLGRFSFREGSWWLSNVGSAIALDICDASSPSKMTITPGTAAPIPFAANLIRFHAGQSSYELEVRLILADRVEAIDDPSAGTPTITAARVPLNHEQLLLLVALAEPRLRHRGAPSSEIPPNRVVTTRLGWSTTKFNRKLDNLCAKFDKLGVSGLKGDLGGLASKRRERLVDHIVTVGIVEPRHLELLDASPRS